MTQKDTKVFSMTGFGKFQLERENLQVTVEIKSVNHRFKDVRFKMSSHLSPLEIEMRNTINANFKRGSFDIFINYKKIDTGARFDDFDEEKIKAFLKKIKSMADAEGIGVSVKPTEFLRSEFQKDQDDTFSEVLLEMTREAFPHAIEELKKSRNVEGEKLVAVLREHRNHFEENYLEIKKLSGSFEDTVKERLNKRFEEFQKSMPVDEPRFMQEVIYYLEKMDIQEELNRIQIHLEKFDSIFKTGGEVGRQLDFLLQELNRETNTTGSKSSIEEISSRVVQMKVHMEKIREQALNLE